MLFHLYFDDFPFIIFGLLDKETSIEPTCYIIHVMYDININICKYYFVFNKNLSPCLKTVTKKKLARLLFMTHKLEGGF